MPSTILSYSIVADSATATGLKWDTPAAGGGMTELTAAGSPLTLSGASVSFTSIPTTYKNLQLWIYNYKPATDDAQLIYRCNSDTGANYLSDSRMNGSNVNPNGTFNYLSLGQDNSTANGAIIVNFYDYAKTTDAYIQDTRGYTNNATTATNLNLWASWNIYRTTGSAITSITLLTTSGNLTSGTARLFGVS